MTDKQDLGSLIIPDTLPHADDFVENREHFYYSTFWWGGQNVDAAMWWKDAAGTCHFRCVLTEDSLEPVQPKEAANREIDCGAFADLLDKLVNIGILDMRSQPKARAISHCDSVMSIRLANGKHNVIRIRGAVPEDKRKWEIADLVMEIAPEFYPRSQRSDGQTS